MSDASPALTVRGLHVTVPVGGCPQALVDGVSFDLAPGEIVGLVGESGSGKTVTASALLGLVPGPVGAMRTGLMRTGPMRTGAMRADALRLGDQDLLALDDRGWRRVRGRDIAMVFQEPSSALDPVFSVGAQLVEVLRRHRPLSRRDARREAIELLAGVGLPDPERALRRYPHQLSGGMRQRALVAMALSCGPRLVVADEPTSALDVTTQAQVLDLLESRVRAAGVAMLLVTHDLAVVRRVCDRALVMQAGRIVEEGPVKSLMDRPSHPCTVAMLAALPRLAAGARP